MTLDALILVALGLSMDAFGASVGRGAAHRHLRLGQILRIAAVFGVFATAAPVLGWAIGAAFYPLVSALDHWIAFGLLSIVGGKMIFDALGRRERTQTVQGFRLLVLLSAALATNIDAAVVGLTLPALRVNVLVAAFTIGAVNFLSAAAGLRLGARTGVAFGHKAEIAGGALLIAIGVKILIEHIYFGLGAGP